MDGRSALIVATSAYADTRLAPLSGPASDAAALQEVLAEPSIGGFDVSVALDQWAAVVSERLETFFANRQREELLVVHFSGHGLKDDDGQLYLAAADTKIDHLMSTGIEAGWINRLMNRCRSERVALFLDCCFAGSFSSAMTRRSGGDRAGVRDAFSGKGRVVIAASDAMQYSFEAGRRVGEPPEPSPFTRALVDGLRTGEADRDEDGNVSINELFDYLEERVRESSPAQTPTRSALNQTGDWVIARSTRTPSVRLLPERVQLLLKSEHAIDRLEVIMDLDHLRSTGGEPRLAEAATKALEGLSADDSRRVAERAREVLGAAPASVGDATAAVVSAPVRTTAELVGSEPSVKSADATTVGQQLPHADTNELMGALRRPRLGQRDVFRAIGRAVLGSIIGVGVALIPWLDWYLRGYDYLVYDMLEALWGIIFLSTLLAAAIEVGRLSISVRAGSAWQAALSNRWLVAFTVGAAVALAGVLVGWPTDGPLWWRGWGRYVDDFQELASLPGAVLWAMVASSLGFVIAEKIVGWRVPHRDAFVVSLSEPEGERDGFN